MKKRNKRNRNLLFILLALFILVFILLSFESGRGILGMVVSGVKSVSDVVSSSLKSASEKTANAESVAIPGTEVAQAEIPSEEACIMCESSFSSGESDSESDCPETMVCENGCCITPTCDSDTYVCPDGSVVGRVPPNCDFAACMEIAVRTENTEYLANEPVILKSSATLKSLPIQQTFPDSPRRIEILQNGLSIESPISGTLTYDHKDNFNDESSTTKWYLETDKNKYELLFNKNPAFSDGGKAVEIASGMILNNQLAPQEFTIDNGDKSEKILGDANTAVILIRSSSQSSEPEPISVADAYDGFFNPQHFGGLASYVKEASYNKVNAVGNVSGWFTLDIAPEEFCEVPINAVLSATSGVPFANYQYIAVVFPYTYCDYGGRAFGYIPTSVGSKYVTYIDGAGMIDYGTVPHEFGHLFGLAHASDRECGNLVVGGETEPENSYSPVIGDKCQAYAYADLFDIMGGTWSKGHMDPYHKNKLGWLEPSQLLNVQQTGTYTIEPIETSSSGVKGLKIERDATGESWLFPQDYYIDYRRPIGYDEFNYNEYNSLVPEGIYNGAMVRVNYDSDIIDTSLLDMSPHENPDWGSHIQDTYDVVLREDKSYLDDQNSILLKTNSLDENSLEIFVGFGSKIYNWDDAPVSGLLTIEVQKKTGGNWQNYQYLIYESQRTIPANGYFDLTELWNSAGGWTTDEFGEYRIFIEFKNTVKTWSDYSNEFVVKHSPRHVFITSGSWNGNLGGIIGADAKCQGAALSVNQKKVYKAWISDSQTSAAERLEHSLNDYILFDGTIIAHNWDDLTDGTIQNPIKVTENNDILSPVFVWTGTSPEGLSAPNYCNDWQSSFVTGELGYSEATYESWTMMGDLFCFYFSSLYCFEQDAEVEECVDSDVDIRHPDGVNKEVMGIVFPLAGDSEQDSCLDSNHVDEVYCDSNGTIGNVELDCGDSRICESGACIEQKRFVFVTKKTWTGNLGGIEGADAKCQQAATSVGLPGNFKAWISDSQTSAAERLEHSNSPYLRLDGVIVADNWSDFVDGTLYASINKTETGVEVSPSSVWTGTLGNGNSDVYNCLNWSSSYYQHRAMTGMTHLFSEGNWTANSNNRFCNSPYRLYCIQQGT